MHNASGLPYSKNTKAEWSKWKNIAFPSHGTISAPLWQKEASDKSPKSEKVVFFRLDLACSTSNLSFEQKHSSCWKILSQDIMILHWCQCTWQTHFANLREISFSSVASLFVIVGQICSWTNVGNFTMLKCVEYYRLSNQPYKSSKHKFDNW